MIYQGKPYSCGPAALSNACNWVFGNSELCPSEDQILELIEHHNKQAPTEGTSEHDLKRVLKHFEIPFFTVSYRHKLSAPKHVANVLLNGGAVVCHGNKSKHWFVLIAALYNFDRNLHGFAVVDSADSDIVVKWTIDKLIDNWAGEGNRRCYGIVIG